MVHMAAMAMAMVNPMAMGAILRMRKSQKENSRCLKGGGKGFGGNASRRLAVEKV
jgi:hypothetical protein